MVNPLASASNHFSTSTILIVDDNPNNLHVAVDSLSELGATVIIALSSQRGLKRAEYARPDLILLDILMPEMNGFEVCRRLKQNPITQAIPVIFMTALADTADKVRGLQVGGIDYITKPFQIEELLARVANHLTMQRFIQTIQADNLALREFVQVPLPRLQPEVPTSKLQQALEYIQANLDENITLEAIASELGMSQFHFCRWFKQSMQIAPYQYVLQQRVEKAKVLLKSSDLSIVTIALTCGFNSQSHLINRFKKQTGLTPKAYRNSF